jgi:hypothetical protein
VEVFNAELAYNLCFGAYGHDLSGLDLSQSLFGDGTLLDESNEAKRRRIARVGRA